MLLVLVLVLIVDRPKLCFGGGSLVDGLGCSVVVVLGNTNATDASGSKSAMVMTSGRVLRLLVDALSKWLSEEETVGVVLTPRDEDVVVGMVVDI